MTGSELIAQERQRQIKEEGWTAEHDLGHDRGELIEAARAYALYAESIYYSKNNVTFSDLRKGHPPSDWPWNRDWWKPSEDPIRNLIKAGALIAAEIDRLQYVKKLKGDSQ